MLAGIYNITCEQGATFVRSIVLKYPDPADPTHSTYLPWDLSGYTARMQARRTVSSTSTLFEVTTENGGIELETNEQGEVLLRLNPEQTAALGSDGVYDLEIIDSNGDVYRVLQGDFFLSLEVTR
jgi:hypothetical protein